VRRPVGLAAERQQRKTSLVDLPSLGFRKFGGVTRFVFLMFSDDEKMKSLKNTPDSPGSRMKETTGGRFP
jgi:hypothetical protein